MAIIVALDGVLRDEQKVPVPGSLKLYRSLLESYRVLISADDGAYEAERWCRIHGIWDYAELYDRSKKLPDLSIRASHINAARAAGGQLELLIDSDSDNCKYALSVGVPSLFYASPKLVARKTQIRSWAEIEEVVEAQKALAVGLDPELERYE